MACDYSASRVQRVVSVNTSDIGGGAERIAAALFQNGLLNAGDFYYRYTVSEIIERDCAPDAFRDSLERMLRGALDARKPASSVLEVMPPKAA